MKGYFFMNEIKLAVIGGDIRMIYCAKKLAEYGFEVSFCGFDSAGRDCGDAVRCRTVKDVVKGAAVVILPVPYSYDGCRINAPFSSSEIRVDEVLEDVNPTQLILAGVCPPGFIEKAEAAYLSVIDYMKDEELTVKNAIPTAEGALELAMKELDVTVHGTKTLVLGYGRAGKAAAAAFSALHSSVTVCARRADALAWAAAAGYGTADIKDICRAVQDKDIIINTVPALTVDNNVLSFSGKDTLIIDLASVPGGVDFEAASHRGLKAIHALSLPGKVAPKTAGENIADAVISAMRKKGVI